MSNFPFQPVSGADAPATSAQKSMIQYRARQAQMEPEQLVRFIRETVGTEFGQLTRREASKVIDELGAQPVRPPLYRDLSH